VAQQNLQEFPNSFILKSNEDDGGVEFSSSSNRFAD
jgi:hypothetical protein